MLRIYRTYILIVIVITIFMFQSSYSFGQKRKSHYTHTIAYVNDSKSIDQDNNSYIRHKGLGFDVKYRGELVISNDDKDITSISDGGFIEITKSSFGSKRKLVIESDRSGNLTKKYFINLRKRDYQPEGEKWLAEILPEVIKTTAVGAASRVSRFYAKGGVQAVLEEIKKMDNDFTKEAYFKSLVAKNLKMDELNLVLEQSGQQIQSDYYLTELLKIIINNESIPDSQLPDLLGVTKEVKSDYYLAEVLMELMAERKLSQENMNMVLNLSKEIQSDHYKTEVVKKVIKNNELSTEAYNTFIEIMHDVQSDHYMSEIIKELWRSKLKMDQNKLTALLELVNDNIQSDFYKSNFYKDLSKLNLTENQLIKTLNHTKDIRSDFYLSEVLIAFSKQVKGASEAVKSAYKDALKSISSGHYYRKVATAID